MLVPVAIEGSIMHNLCLITYRKVLLIATAFYLYCVIIYSRMKQGKYYLGILLLIASLVLASCSGSFRPGDFRLVFTDLSTGSEASIRALCVVNENIVWAGGSGGQYLLTANGGNTWKTGIVEGAETDDFRSIYAWGPSRAQVFGTSSPGRGYMTETAGEEWQLVFEDSTAGVFFNSLSYADEFRGVALSDPVDSISYIIKTNDGGFSWSRITGLPVLNDSEYNFAASNSCIQYNRSGRIWMVTGGGDSRVFTSADHGDNWDVAPSGLAYSVPSGGIFSVSFVDESKGIIVGGTYDKPELNDRIAAFTLDGGEKWILSDKMPAEFRSCVFWMKYRNRDIAVAVGKTGIDISTDHGNSWHNISDKGYYTGRAVPGTSTAFLAGSDGRIAKIVLKRRNNKSGTEETDAAGQAITNDE